MLLQEKVQKFQLANSSLCQKKKKKNIQHMSERSSLRVKDHILVMQLFNFVELIAPLMYSILFLVRSWNVTTFRAAFTALPPGIFLPGIFIIQKRLLHSYSDDERKAQRAQAIDIKGVI